jgi:hypothetical protein|tara:strand:+ start:49 stop:321 length:273 start_codon:yes stop_codon:yes gene_type:complete
MGKDRAKTDNELLFEKMNPNLPKDLSNYKMGRSFKDPETGEMKVELIKLKKRKQKSGMSLEQYRPKNNKKIKKDNFFKGGSVKKKTKKKT